MSNWAVFFCTSLGSMFARASSIVRIASAVVAAVGGCLHVFIVFNLYRLLEVCKSVHAPQIIQHLLWSCGSTCQISDYLLLISLLQIFNICRILCSEGGYMEKIVLASSMKISRSSGRPEN